MWLWLGQAPQRRWGLASDRVWGRCVSSASRISEVSKEPGPATSSCTRFPASEIHEVSSRIFRHPRKVLNFLRNCLAASPEKEEADSNPVPEPTRESQFSKSRKTALSTSRIPREERRQLVKRLLTLEVQQECFSSSKKAGALDLQQGVRSSSLDSNI